MEYVKINELSSLICLKCKNMLCPKCKNPIADNTNICEWCGGKIVVLNQSESQTTDLDNELLNLLNQKKDSYGRTYNLPKAIKLYRLRTGKNKYESNYYVMRLNHFRFIKDADEVAWQLEWAKVKKRQKTMAWIFLFTVIYAPLSIIFFNQLKQYEKLGL